MEFGPIEQLLLYFLLPLWIMVMTSLKPMEEIRLGNIIALPAAMTFEAWSKAWSARA